MKLFLNATVLTHPFLPPAEAVLVDDHGRVVFVGKLNEINLPSHAEQVDLGGQTLIPAFNDAHIHIWKLGLLLTVQVDVREHGAVGFNSLVRILQAHAERSPEGWILGRGYDEATLAEGVHPTREVLDAVSPDRPLALTRICGHIMALNTRALQLANITANTPDPSGGIIDRDEHGNPSGIIRENAMALVNRVIPPITDAQLANAILATHQHQLRLGIVSATDPLVTPDHLRVYRQLEAEKRLLVRTNCLAVRRLDGGTETLPLPEKFVSEMLRVDSVKFFADGGLSGATASIYGEYLDVGGQGILRYETADMLELMWEAHHQGYRIGTHAIGDRALDQVLTCYESLYARHPHAPRHRVEHFGLPLPEHIAMCQRMNVIAVMQTIFLPALGRNYRRYLNQSYLDRAYPARTLWDANITVALSSDAPVVPNDDPIAGMIAAVNRHDHNGQPIGENEALTVAESLWGYTMGGAIASGDEANFGSIEVGKWADFAVLNRNPLLTPTHELASVHVLQTYRAGECVYTR
ncbi:MAG: amidohydrolase [Phototrophicaceae bacterium]